MKSMLHLKFIALYIIFGFLCLFTTATLTTQLVEDRLMEDTSQTLYREAALIASDYLPSYFTDGSSIDAVQAQLAAMRLYLDASLWFVDSTGTMITSSNIENTSAPEAIEDFNPAEIGGNQYISGTYHGYFDEDVITVMAPVTEGFFTKGYLLIHSPAANIEIRCGAVMFPVYISLGFIYLLPLNYLYRRGVKTTLSVMFLAWSYTMLVFIFCAEILGEINAFYERIPLWDTLLHTVNGFVAAAIGFSLVDLMNRSERISFSLSPLFAVLVAFCVSMTIGVMWEFFEFFMDQVFQLDMQKDTVIQSFSTVVLDPSHGNTPIRLEDIRDVAVNGTSLGLGGYLDIGLIDTMQDLLVNFIGAVLFSFFGYFCMKGRDKRKLLRTLVPRRKEKN